MLKMLLKMNPTHNQVSITKHYSELQTVRPLSKWFSKVLLLGCLTRQVTCTYNYLESFQPHFMHSLIQWSNEPSIPWFQFTYNSYKMFFSFNTFQIKTQSQKHTAGPSSNAGSAATFSSESSISHITTRSCTSKKVC
jgi:hypothetical protein